MFEKILIANRGDQLPIGSVAAKNREGIFSAEVAHV